MLLLYEELLFVDKKQYRMCQCLHKQALTQELMHNDQDANDRKDHNDQEPNNNQVLQARLRSQKASQQLIMRLSKVLNDEVSYTFSLNHH